MFKVNGELILNKIEEMGYTQYKFSREIGTSQPTFSRMVNNRGTNVDLEILYKISKILDLKIDKIIINDTTDEPYISNKLLISQMESNINDLHEKITTIKERYNKNTKKPLPNQMYLNLTGDDDVMTVAETKAFYKIENLLNKNLINKELLLKNLYNLLDKENLSEKDRNEIDYMFNLIFRNPNIFTKKEMNNLYKEFGIYKINDTIPES